MDLRTPLARAKGLGEARQGCEKWWAQRVTAVALLPLTVWFVWFLAQLVQLPHADMLAWLGKPVNAVLLLAYLGTAFYHAVLGLTVIVEDYMHLFWLKALSLLALRLFVGLLAAVAVFAVVRIVP